MKKHLFTIASLFSLSTFAQVGIGTTSPSEALDIESNDGTKTSIDINNTGAGDPLIHFQLGGTSSFTMGVDDSDNDKFKIGTSALETNTAFSINASKQVSIGHANPSATLDVDGDAIFNESGASKDFRIEGLSQANLFFVDGSADFIGIATSSPGATLDVRGSAIFNEDGADSDFRVEGDTEANLLFVDASTDRVGIGTASPTYLLHVYNGDAATGSEPLIETNNTRWAGITYKNTNNAWFAGIPSGGASRFAIVDNTAGLERVSVNTSGDFGIGNTSPTAKLDVDGSAIFNESGAAVDFRVEGDTEENLLFVDGSADNIGIGTSAPAYKLEVAGAVMLEDMAAPTNSASHSGIYSNSGELNAFDASGNSTVISPHHFSLVSPSEKMAWSFYSKNEIIGQQVNVDMMKAIRVLENISGEKLVHKADLEGNSIDATTSAISLKAQLNIQAKKLQDQQEIINAQQKELAALKKMEVKEAKCNAQKLAQLEAKINALLENTNKDK